MTDPTPGTGQEISEGDEVTLRSARGPIRRTVVKVLGDVLVVGTRSDLVKARSFGVDRYAVGCRRADVIEVVPLDESRGAL